MVFSDGSPSALDKQAPGTTAAESAASVIPVLVDRFMGLYSRFALCCDTA